MPDSESTAAVAPEASAQTTTEKKDGPANLSGPELAQRFIRRQNEADKAAAKQTAAAPAETQVVPEKTEEAAATGEAKADPAEAESKAEEKPEETKAEPTAEEKADEALSPETHTLDPKVQARIDRRIGKEVAKTKELQRQLNELKVQFLERQSQQPSAKPQVVPMPSGAMPLANIEDVNSLVGLQQEAKSAIRFVEEQLERDDFPEQGVEIDGKLFRKEDLRAVKRNAKLTLEDHIPQRVQFLTQRQQVQQRAFEDFPFLKDSSDPLYVQAKAIAANPANAWLRNIPGSDYIIGAYAKGIAAMEAEKQAKAKAKPATVKQDKPANSQTAVSADTGGSRIPAGSAAAKASKTASDEAKAKGGLSGKDFAKLLSLKSQLRQQSR